MGLADTPEPPYYAAVFTSQHTGEGIDEYDRTAAAMERLAAMQPGYLGIEAARGSDGVGVTVSYWESEEAIAAWKAQLDHQGAQQAGRDQWYDRYVVRVARVERAYRFDR